MRSNSDIHIVPYEQQHFEALADLWHRSWHSVLPREANKQSPEMLRERFLRASQENWHILVAVIGKTPIGFAALIEQNNCLDQLFVDPSATGTGIGSMLLDVVKERLAGGFWLRAAAENDSACRFYERHGLLRGETAPHPRLGHPTVIYQWSGSLEKS